MVYLGVQVEKRAREGSRSVQLGTATLDLASRRLFEAGVGAYGSRYSVYVRELIYFRFLRHKVYKASSRGPSFQKLHL